MRWRRPQISDRESKRDVSPELGVGQQDISRTIQVLEDAEVSPIQLFGVSPRTQEAKRHGGQGCRSHSLPVLRLVDPGRELSRHRHVCSKALNDALASEGTEHEPELE